MNLGFARVENYTDYEIWELSAKFTNGSMYRVLVQSFWLYVKFLSFSDLIWFDEIMRKVQASHDNAQYRAYLCTTHR